MKLKIFCCLLCFCTHSVCFAQADTLGAIILPPKYDNIREKFDNGFLIYTLNGLDGLLDAEGKELTPPLYDGWGPGFMHNYQSVRQNGLWGVIDTNGKIIAPCRYSELIAFYHVEINNDREKIVKSERALAQIDSKFGIIDTLGNEIIPIEYDFITPLNANTNIR